MHFDSLIASHLALPPAPRVMDAETEDLYYREHSGPDVPSLRGLVARLVRLLRAPGRRHAILR